MTLDWTNDDFELLEEPEPTEDERHEWWREELEKNARENADWAYIEHQDKLAQLGEQVLPILRDLISSSPCQLAPDGSCRAHNWPGWPEALTLCPYQRAKELLQQHASPESDPTP